MMNTDIPQGLRRTYMVAFVLQLVLGLAGTFAAGLVGTIANHPVNDPDVNFGLGVTTLGLALASFIALRAPSWQEIRLLTLLQAFVGFVGGVGSLLIYFVPSLVGATGFPPVTLIVAVVNTALGMAFGYFYVKLNGAGLPKYT